MRGRSSFLRLALACAACVAVPTLAVVGASCRSAEPAPSGPVPSVTFAPTILGTPALVSQFKTLSLTIYAANAVDGGITCNTGTGLLSGTTASTPTLDDTPTFHALETGCGVGYTRCFNLATATDTSSAQVFSAIGYSDMAHMNEIAAGCYSLKLGDGGTVSVPIVMWSTLPPPSMCGDGTLNPGETCDPPAVADGGATAACSAMCQTVEQQLSVGTGPTGSLTTTGAAGDKANPSFVWPVGGNFLGFFGDKSSGSSQIAMRVLSDTLAGTSVLGPIAETESIYLPNTPGGTVPPSPEAHSQQQPAAVQDASGTTYVVFADDTATPGTFAINLRSLDANLNAQQAAPCPISTVGDAGAGLGNLSFPAVAVAGAGTLTNPALYIAWQDAAEAIYGRSYKPGVAGACGTVGALTRLSTTGTLNSHVVLAGIPSGWVAVWKSGSDIIVQAIGSSNDALAGMPVAIEPQGDVGSSPSVASIPSGGAVAGANIGAFAVAWSDQVAANRPTIFVERFNNTGHTVAGDGPTQVSQSANGEVTPFIAASPTNAGSYVVAWADQGSSGQVRARLLNGTLGFLSVEDAGATSSAYLPNAIDGTTNEFVVSTAAGSPVNPTVAVGGGVSTMYNGAPFIAFGWADSTSSPFGILARRFPTP